MINKSSYFYTSANHFQSCTLLIPHPSHHHLPFPFNTSTPSICPLAIPNPLFLSLALMAKDTGASRHSPGASARILCSTLVTLLIFAGIIALVLYLVYRPSHPHFTILSAAIFRLTKAASAAPASAISTAFQFTISIRNPNHRAAIQYDRLCAYVSYRDQPITPPSSLPSLYQESDGMVAVSPVIGGEVVPVSSEVEAGLMTEGGYGVVPLRLVITGRVKYRPGPFRSAWVNLFVKCDMLVGFKKGVSGQVPLLGQSECDVDT